MVVKGGNLKINNGLLLSSLILDYMIIRVKEKESGEGKIKRTGEREKRVREGRTKRKTKRLWEGAFLITILRWR